MEDRSVEKVCCRCRERLPRSHFHRCKTYKDGLQKECKDCRSTVNRTSSKANGQAYRQARRRKVHVNLLDKAKVRARQKGLSYDLDDHRAALEARATKGVCELTGIPFRFDEEHRFYLPSLDRIDASMGYTYDNVRIILYGLNTAFGNWGADVLIEAVAQIRRTEQWRRAA